MEDGVVAFVNGTGITIDVLAGGLSCCCHGFGMLDEVVD